MRHVLAGVLIALLVCSLLWAALPFTDTFTNTTGTVLTTHSASWTMNTGTAGIYNNYLVSRTAGAAFIARVNSETFADDQYAQCTIQPDPLSSTYNMGPAVRISTSGAQTLYFADFSSNLLRLRKTVTGTSTTLKSHSRTQTPGEVIRIEAVAATQKVYINGVEIPELADTDASISSGAAGMRGFDYAGSDGLGQNGCDDFEAGNVSAGGSAPIRRRPIMMFFTLPEFAR